jgi:hypothetical protein
MLPFGDLVAAASSQTAWRASSARSKAQGRRLISPLALRKAISSTT